MGIPTNITEDSILDAIQFIDKHGVPDQNKSSKYDLVSSSGNRYPPKYIIAIANHLVNKSLIETDTFHSAEARDFLKELNFKIETKQVKYELVITANNISSSDERFTLDNIGLGDSFKPLDAYYMTSSGEIIKRNYYKGERRNSNQTMPRLACQIFEQSIASLSVESKESFPVCQYTLNSTIISGIYSSVDEFRSHINSIEYLIYKYEGGRQFVFYCWNIFSTIMFVQECLKRFGKEEDKFVLIYREKEKKEGREEDKLENLEPEAKGVIGYTNPYSNILVESKNIIFRGAPGTGKTYLAREIAADIVSNGYYADYTLLSDEQNKQIEFIQFHPSYDYTDFVEGLRPIIKDDGSMGFDIQTGIFKRFVNRARKNFENSKKTQDALIKEASFQEVISDYFSSIEFGIDEFKTLRGSKFYINGIDEKNISISIPDNEKSNNIYLKISELKEMLDSGQNFSQPKDVTQFFKRPTTIQRDPYTLIVFGNIQSKISTVTKPVIDKESLKPYVFIIDEINRGEISKIFGELFFSIDPGYRGKLGEVCTQYANLHDESDEKFYIPENVYIIGTMNDIDRSVDSFDFAMRRRFRFIEIKADERLEMLDLLEDKKEDAIARMTALNNEISKVDELNANYHIGASYFLKLKTLSLQQLWDDYLEPLLQEYIRGMYDELSIMEKLEKAFWSTDLKLGENDDQNNS